MNINILKTETTEDPLGRGYSGMTDKQVADDQNIINRTTNKTILTGTEIINAIDKAEFNALSASSKALIWNIVHIDGGVNPFGLEAELFQDVFGASITITNLQALRVNNVSRGIELGIGTIFIADIEDVRRI